MKKIVDLNLARVIAMLAVIMIHVTSPFLEGNGEILILGMEPAFILNQISRFAVPLFIIISGASLNLSSHQDKVGSFYKKRFIKTGLPFLFWSLICLLASQTATFTGMFALGAESIATFLRVWLLGESAPHLYFIVIIFQCYLLYPLLKKAVEKYPLASLVISLIITVAIQQLFRAYKQGVDMIPDFIQPYLWLLLPTWIVYFVLGMLLTRERMLKLRQLCTRFAWVIFAATLGFALFYAVRSHITLDYESIKPSLIIFSSLVLLAAFALWGRLEKKPVLAEKAAEYINFLADHTSTIYFEHVLVLYALRCLPVFYGSVGRMLLLYVAAVIVSVMLAVSTDIIWEWIITDVKQKLLKKNS